VIRIGNQTSYAASPAGPFDFAVANGFDAFEWFPDKKPGAGWDDTDLSGDERARIREVARTRGMQMSVHARWQANPLQPGSMQLFEADLGLARDLGATLLNVHLYAEQGLPAFVSAIQPLVQRTREAGLQLTIENTPHHPPELFNELFSLLAAEKQVGMCLDIGHANLCSATRNDYLGFVDRLSPNVPIIHAHLHENWGDSDSHLTLFTGPSAQNDAGIRGLIERLERRGFSGSFILEQWPEPPTLLVQARDRLRPMIVKVEGKTEGRAARLETRAEQATSTQQVPVENAAVSGSRGSGAVAARVEATTEIENENEDEGEQREQRLSRTAGAADFRGRLIAGDEQAKSWREKLGAVKELLESSEARLSETEMVELSVYLQFLRMGQIRCEEDGRHFRPGHHASLALEIREQLAKRAPAESGFLRRKIEAWLPSSAQSFRTAEPLTRIRDIAHRNDIPSELKHEIKTTLQNKLHRCAGPEDLVVSEKILQRITAPGAAYSPEFVEQFKIFHQELKEFFNARSFDEQLRALAPQADKKQTRLIQAILKRKSQGGLAEQIELFVTVTDLRLSLGVSGTQQTSGGAVSRGRGRLGSDSLPPSGIGEDGGFLMADLGLEDFGFVLLSQIINQLDTGPFEWRVWLRLLGFAVTNLRLGQIEPEECRALESELRAWSAALKQPGREELLRIKATVERGRRLAENYSAHVLSLFASEAKTLGRALGIEENVIRTFCEADIRAHLIFQVSKLCSSLLRRLRAELKLPPWDVLVTGQAEGVLQAVRQLNGTKDGFQKPAILLLERASGDEEIPGGVAGILLAHDLPHLSHLAVRARQAGTILVCTDEPSFFGTIKPLKGQSVLLKATAEKVECVPSKGATERAPAKSSKQRVAFPAVQVESGAAVLPLEKAVPERTGAKAAGAARLAQLAQKGRFKTAAGLALTFGAMEEALAANPGLNQQYHELLSKTADAKVEDLLARAESLREIIQRSEVPQKIISQISGHFGAGKQLMVRSSANAEDLPELAGAGLYESVAGVQPDHAAAAIKQVWASVWSARAALSRQQTGVPHERVRMAVLIQEMLPADFSFVLHTTNPINQSKDEVYAELAVGLGETLVSGAERGNPYRLVCNTKTGETTVWAFANFSHALVAAPGNGPAWKSVDYSQVGLSADFAQLKRVGKRIAEIGRFVADAFGAPLDIEGAIVGEDVYLVQARPQQGVRGGLA
jgi:phosphoglucan,water dikinase